MPRKLFLIFASALILTACSTQNNVAFQTASPMATQTAMNTHTLKLDIFNIPTPTPAPSVACGLGQTCGDGCVQDGPATSDAQCCNQPNICGNGGPDQMTCSDWWHSVGGSGFWCDAKPIIYLYPQTPTQVSVKVTVPGQVTVSIPSYPAQTGWQNILALPSGAFWYQKKQYHELFYETSQQKAPPPTTGIVVAKNDLAPQLTSLTARLGLLPSEQQELLAYWLPRLQNLNSQYIQISVFSAKEKQTLDRVDITPKPDTFIQFILYFKPLAQPVNLPPIVYPSVPNRTGFTAVEWGGIVDH